LIAEDALAWTVGRVRGAADLQFRLHHDGRRLRALLCIFR
jgi:hypothetical protein